jgi:hypothetical protein
VPDVALPANITDMLISVFVGGKQKTASVFDPVTNFVTLYQALPVPGILAVLS